MIDITGAQLQTLTPALKALPQRAALYAKVLNQTLVDASISTNLRLWNFVGQSATETGGFRSLIESTTYTKPETLVKLFRNVQGLEHARRLVEAGPIAIGNTVYAGKNGNGDIASGDGYRFRGRGFLQITGRANYRAIGKLLGEPLEEQPDLIGEPELAAQAAAQYWVVRKINTPADVDDVITVTRLVNGAGLAGLADRQAWHDHAKRVWPLAEGSGAQPD